VDSRYLSRLPFIIIFNITTNLTLSEPKNPKDTAHARIYDRILERCAPVLFNVRNYRTENAENTKNDIRELFSKEDSL
jgi:DNA replication protein DnaC